MAEAYKADWLDREAHWSHVPYFIYGRICYLVFAWNSENPYQAVPRNDQLFRTKHKGFIYERCIFLFLGEKVDAQDYFRTSVTNSKLGDSLLPYPPRIGSSAGKQHMILSDSKTNCRYDSISSENLDPSHDSSVVSAPLLTSTVVSKPGSNQLAKLAADCEMQPPTSTAAPNRRNLLGATATNSPLTPR